MATRTPRVDPSSTHTLTIPTSPIRAFSTLKSRRPVRDRQLVPSSLSHPLKFSAFSPRSPASTLPQTPLYTPSTYSYPRRAPTNPTLARVPAHRTQMPQELAFPVLTWSVSHPLIPIACPSSACGLQVALFVVPKLPRRDEITVWDVQYV
ncbi:hypothetical protein OF83DRAFT_218536 [Amylostereum chailletii]|nr:hypothetical protein OF83DRAFT_218536 [Amylostereum chailletii]